MLEAQSTVVKGVVDDAQSVHEPRIAVWMHHDRGVAGIEERKGNSDEDVETKCAESVAVVAPPSIPPTSTPALARQYSVDVVSSRACLCGCCLRLAG